MSKPRTRKRFYLGFNWATQSREIFRSAERPTTIQTHPQYNHIVGPFMTRAGAEFMRDAPGMAKNVTEAEERAKDRRSYGYKE